MPRPVLPVPPRLWTEEDRLKVIGLLKQGATQGMVAKAMNISRCAAVGRIYRDKELLSLVNRAASNPALKLKSSNRSPAVACGATVLAFVEPVAPFSHHQTRAMALIGTGKHWCKWPINNDPHVLGGILCCGAETLPFDVYCGIHRQEATDHLWKRKA